MALPTVESLTADLGVYVETSAATNPYVGECCAQAITFIGKKFAPNLQPTHVAPATLTWPDGSTAALSRVGQTVSAVVTPGNPDALPAGTQLVPPAFAPAGLGYQLAFASKLVPGAGRYLITLIETDASTTAQMMVAGDPGPYLPFTTQWLADVIDSGPGSDDPAAYIVPEIFDRMPQQQYEREVMELGADLFFRRQAKNGVVSVNALEGAIARVSKDPYAASEARLARFLGLGFA